MVVHLTRRWRLGAIFPWAGALAFGVFLAVKPAEGQVFATQAPDGSNALVADDTYHPQAYAYSCMIASMEMELDEPQVVNNNPFVANLIATGNTYAQGYMYDMIHANLIGPANPAPLNLAPSNVAYNAANNPALNNPNYFYSTYAYPGSDINGAQFGLNVLNGNSALITPAPPGLGPAGTAYVSYNLGNPLLSYFTNWDYSSRTIAAAISTYGAPAVIGMNPNPFGIFNGQLSGQHAISVYGVSYNGNAPAANAAYTITGFYVHDPWTGYVQNQVTAGNYTQLANGKVVNAQGQAVPLGLGENTWLRYGMLPAIAGAPQVALPNGTIVSPGNFSWYNYFTPSAPSPSPYTTVFNGVGFKFEVEPQGPEVPDTGDNGLYSSIPPVPALLGSQVTAAQADADAISDLSTTGDLSDEPGFEGGSFDAADEMLLQNPDDPTVEGDWLVPYDGSGGVNDVTGALLVDEDTGVIDQATWLDPNDPMTSMSLAEIDEMYTDQLDGIVEDDNELPEPTSVLLLTGVAGMALTRRRRRTIG
ncbi:MAG TPA: PEP-CTERM sorting domain-containing protein [Tepidisphaeraceae bacterium]|nr:PEP-CTERM sorting domain-containing protein [Tepidisphaeraceae bacterium]